MIKAKLCGIGDDKDFNLNYIIIEKDKNLFKWLSNFFKNMSSSYSETYDYHDKKGRYITRKKQLKDYIDVHENKWFMNKNTRIDIFYGKDKVFITFINLKEKYRKKLINNLNKTAVWKKIKKIKYKGGKSIER